MLSSSFIKLMEVLPKPLVMKLAKMKVNGYMRKYAKINVKGLENIDKDYLNLFKTMKSSKLQTFIHLKLPMSIDKLFSGIKISVTYMVVAATVAEWLGGTKGLGVYMVRAKSAYALDKVFASTIIVVVLSLIFVGLVNIAKKIIIKHK